MVSLAACGGDDSGTRPPTDGSVPPTDGSQPPDSVGLWLEPGAAIVRSGETLTFDAFSIASDGSRATVTDEGTWSSDAPSVFTVTSGGSDAGTLSAEATGTGTLIFEAPDGRQARASVEVVRSEEEIEEDVRDTLPVDVFASLAPGTPLLAKVANPLLFYATNLGDEYTASLENVTGGTVLPTDDPIRFDLVPASPDEPMELEVVVSNGERSERVDGFIYPVVLPPGPRVELVNDRLSREVVGTLDEADLTNLRLRVVSDPLFASRYPDEATYRVADVTVTLRRVASGGSAVVRSFSTGDLDLFDFRTRAEAGDRLEVEVHEVQRRNSQDEVLVETQFEPQRWEITLI